MNYEKIIIELLSRIQALEEKIGILPDNDTDNSLEKMINFHRKKKKMSTAEIKNKIEEILESERQAGKKFTEIICGILHKQLELKNAVPMVCNAMKACMKQGDTIIFRSPSGYSATLKVRYYLTETAASLKTAVADAMYYDSQTATETNTNIDTNTNINTNKEKYPDKRAEAAATIRSNMLDNHAQDKAEFMPRLINTPVSVPTNSKNTDDFEVKREKKTDIKPDTIPDIRQHALPDTEKQKTPAKNIASQPPLSATEVWNRIINYEWAIFYLPDGGEFAYIAGNDYLAIVRTNYRLPRADIEKALALYPFKNAVPLQHLRYPSYIYAILTDERIMGLRR